MDSMRPSVDAYDDASADAPGMEAPPVIGSDERRMHVRAYNFWAKLLEGRSFPSIESLDTDQLGDFGGNSVLLDFTSGIENPAIAFVGSAIAEECALDDSVQYIADVPRRSLLSRLTDHYLQIIANRAPIGFEAEFVDEKGASILYRGVLLPFSSDDDTIDFILGVINWKQAAEPALVAALSDEMAASVAAVPHARPTVPVWADGPDSEHHPMSGDDGDTEGDIDDDSSSVAAVSDDPFADDAYEAGDFAAGSFTGDAFAPLPARDDADEHDEDDALLLEELADAADMDGAASAYSDAKPVSINAEDASLADWLAHARDCAEVASQAHVRGRTALYNAVGEAWRFACATAGSPDDYAELLDEAGIAASDRSPMTPIVKLVFGAQYDKTRVAEYAAVLSHAADEGIADDGLSAYISRHPNGIKGLVKDIRAARRADAPVRDPMSGVADLLRRAVPLAQVTLPYVDSDAEFTVLVARRMPDGSHAIVATLAPDDAQTNRTLKAAARAR